MERLTAAESHLDGMVDSLAELVGIETPTGSLASLTRCADLLDGWFATPFGGSASRPSANLPHLLWPGRDGGVLVLGHFDTVWPLGTLGSWPFSIEDGVARGPGVFDMKAGIVQLLTAAKLVTDPGVVTVLLTCDEETGLRRYRFFAAGLLAAHRLVSP